MVLEEDIKKIYMFIKKIYIFIKKYLVDIILGFILFLIFSYFGNKVEIILRESLIIQNFEYEKFDYCEELKDTYYCFNLSEVID